MSDLNKPMTKVSIMAASALPPAIAEALGHMQRPLACPEDVKAKIMALRVPADDVHGTRMNTNWRSGPTTGSKPSGGGGGRWGPAPSAGGGSGPNSGFGRGSWSSLSRHPATTHSTPPNSPASTGSPVSMSNAPPTPPVRRPPPTAAPRFGNKARKDVTTEERMMDRIRDKMNKFSTLTYDATKTWLSQLLDSGETGFLDEFITLVFEKAAAEPPFCALYARLITELIGDFPHLKVDLRRIFDEFIHIFGDAAEEPDAGSAAYDAYVALRERRRYRRGYAAFIGEITKLGVLNCDDLMRTCTVILDGLLTAKKVEGRGQLCEEYAECLMTLVKSCLTILKSTAAPFVARVREASVKDVSLTNKARFNLMDITEMF